MKKRTLSLLVLPLLAMGLKNVAVGQEKAFEARLGTMQFINNSGISLFEGEGRNNQLIGASVAYGWGKENLWLGVVAGYGHAKMNTSSIDEQMALISLGGEARTYAPITDKLSFFNGLRLSALYADNDVAVGSWSDSHSRWGAQAAFSVGMAWQSNAKTQWSLMYELSGGAFFGSKYAPKEAAPLLPKGGNNALWGHSLTIGVTTRL